MKTRMMGAEPGRPNELSPIIRIDTAAQKLMAHVVAGPSALF